MRMVYTAIGRGMGLRDTLYRKEQSCHQDHEGLYERVTHHNVTLLHQFYLFNPLSSSDVNVFRLAI